MSRKNLLSDTDYTSGKDNRFATAVLIAKVSKNECTDQQANVRCIIPDKVDHDGNPLNTKPIPVLQVASEAKRSFAVPRLGTNVLLVKLPNSTSDYAVIGSFYTKNDPPPVSDPMLDYVQYDDGSIMQFNASNGEQTWKLTGKMLWDNEKGADLKFKEAVLIDAGSGSITVKSTGTILLDGTTVQLKGNLNFQGNITHTGNMTTSGVHLDANGHHTTSTAREDVQARLEALEARVTALETRLST
jgi:phage baseplate assembly protein V